MTIYNNAGMPSEQGAAPEILEDLRGHDGLTQAERFQELTRPVPRDWKGELIAALTLERNMLKAKLESVKHGSGWWEVTPAGQKKRCSVNEEEELRIACEEVATLKAKVERLSAPVSDEEWTNVVVVSPQHDHRTWMERKQVNSIIAARASALPTTNPITDDGPDECEGCDKPLRDDEGHETDDMVMLCDECWQGCADDPDCHSEECPCEACAAKIGTMKHPINDDDQRRKDAGWNDRPKARCACGEMIAWYSGEWLHVAGRSGSCADGRLASPAHFLVGMPPAEPEWHVCCGTFQAPDPATHGVTILRGPLKLKHGPDCKGCQDFADEVRRIQAKRPTTAPLP